MALLQDQSNQKRNIQTLRNLYINSNLKYTLYISNHQIWNAVSFTQFIFLLYMLLYIIQYSTSKVFSRNDVIIWGRGVLKIEEKIMPRNSKGVVRNTYMKNRVQTKGKKTGDIIYGWPPNRVV